MRTAFNILKAILGILLGMALTVLGITVLIVSIAARLAIPIAIAIMAVCGAWFVFQAVF